MTKKCPSCGVLVKEDRLVVCPECKTSFTETEPSAGSLTEEEKRQIAKLVWKKHVKFFIGGFSILTLISIALIVFSLVKAYEAGMQKVGEIVAKSVEKEFETERIKATVQGVAKDVASEIMKGEIYPIVEGFQNETALQLTEIQQSKQKITEIEKELQKIAEMTAPNTLSLFSTKIKKTDSGLKADLLFTGKKKEPIGQLDFMVSLPSDSKEKILKLNPSKVTAPFMHREGSPGKIHPTGKSGRLIFTPIFAMNASIEVAVSGPTRVQIEGNYLPRPIMVEIRETTEDAESKYTGILTAELGNLSHSDRNFRPKLEIGWSLDKPGHFIQYAGGTLSRIIPSYRAPTDVLEDIFLDIKGKNRQPIISLKVRDKNGIGLVQIVKNEWRVESPPIIRDRNYTKDTLEVIGRNGDVVLQVKVLGDRIKLNGVFYDSKGKGVAIFPPSMIKFLGSKPPRIAPIFKYPSDLYLGQFV